MKKYLEPLAISLLAIFAPIKAVLLAVFVLIILDMITGMMAAYKRKEKITSAQMRRSISKAVVYEIAICAAFITEKYILEVDFSAVKIIATVIGLTELKSLLENTNSITGTDVFKALIDKLGSTNQSQ